MSLYIGYFIWILFSIGIIVFSKKKYKSNLNPITIYTILWGVCVGIYISKVIRFDLLKINTFITIIFTHIVMILGFLCGSATNMKSVVLIKKRDPIEKRKLLFKTIIFFVILSSISIIPKIYKFYSENGLAMFTNVMNTYTEALYSNSVDETTGFLSLTICIYVAMAYSGSYLSRYGYNKFLIFPMILVCLLQLTDGSRGTLVSSLLLFIAPNIIRPTIFNSITLKQNKKIKRIIYLGIAVLLLITFSRTQNNENIYASDFLNKLPYSSVLYSILFYLSGGIGCLNIILTQPVQHNIYLFRVPALFLNALNITSFDLSNNGNTTLNIPMPNNVSTYIGGLYRESGYLFLIVVFILAVIYGYYYQYGKIHDSIIADSIFSSLFVIFMLSFFIFYGSLAIVWYVFLIGSFFGIFIDYKINFK